MKQLNVVLWCLRIAFAKFIREDQPQMLSKTVKQNNVNIKHTLSESIGNPYIQQNIPKPYMHASISYRYGISFHKVNKQQYNAFEAWVAEQGQTRYLKASRAPYMNHYHAFKGHKVEAIHVFK